MDLKKELNNEQYIAASTIDGPLLIIAGAGSGKTRMLTYRIAHMLENNIDERNILALTFTNKAAKEMGQRIRNLTKKELKHLTTTTFHSFGLGLLKQHIHHLGWKNNFTIYDTNDKLSLIKQVIINLGWSIDAFNLSDVQDYISKYKTKRLEINNNTAENTKILINEYQKYLKTYNAVDFDDLIVKPLELFEKFPEILEKTSNRFKYILVDEFQDTSISQYRLVKALADKNRNLCVVGDDDQSIYSWRGANYENILMFEKDFPERKEIMLERNYRSSKTILDAANNLITNNKQRKDKKLWTKSDKGTNIYLIRPDDGEKEANQVAREIIELHKKENIKFNNFAILTRTNALIPAFESALMMRDVSCHVSGGKSLFERKEIKDILSYLKVIINPDDDVNFLRIINTPRRSIGRVTIDKIKDVANTHNVSLYSALAIMAYSNDYKIRDTTRNSLKFVYNLIEKYSREFEENEDKTRYKVLNHLILEINYKDFLIEENNSEKAVLYKLKGINILSDMLRKWEQNYFNEGASLENWVNRILLNGKDNDDENKTSVNIMTMHASKGLEFDIVYLVGIEDHIIPSQRAIEENPKNIDEERRLFYVAITRAKEKLIISSAKNRIRGTQIIQSAPSRFIQEIPENLIDEAENRLIPKSEISNSFAAMRARLQGK
ncbi:MAG: ATP-dependent helicase [Pleomorphochaeta sp.]|nr:UvrD-helicase domain-containing protein [Sphaerochaetaceae bacterium]